MNRELDKKIAELKGCAILNDSKYGYCCDCSGKPHGDEDDLKEYMVAFGRYEIVVRVRRYSSSIVSAWSLFEEMKNDAKIKYYGRWWVETYDGISASAETAPEAICKAWLKWKELFAE